VSLQGRTALVTGAGQGVGLGIAQRLAAAGASVAANDLVPDRADAAIAQIDPGGGKVIAVPFDVTSLEAVRAGVARIEQELAPIDILVNNAGVPADMNLGQFKDSDPSRWHEWIDINLYGSLFCIHSVLSGMCERQFGRIIQISSGSGSRGLTAGAAIYGGSKAGIEGALRHIALEVAGVGVTVNAIAPGFMEFKGDEALIAQMAATVPVGRLGRPTDIGGAVLWLASEDGSYVTGQTVHVNGGTVQGR
jgi:NAD(P)-dependent dehydrogenase (short-subunit alcohol dehydrogenase family)